MRGAAYVCECRCERVWDTVYAATEVCRAANPNNESLQFDHHRTVCELVRERAVTDPALEIGSRVRH
jgi:hypothetical protein